MWRYTHTNELYHWGIKGQKWGVRRYQNKDGSLTGEGKKRYSDQSESESGVEKQRKGLSKGQKTAIVIGVSAVGVALASYGAYRLHKSGKLGSLISTGKSKVDQLLGKTDATKSTFKKIGHSESVSETLSRVNPTKSHNNCYNCVVATVGRLCGFDMTAKGDTRSGKGLGFDDICKSFGLNPDNETDVRRVMSPSVDKLKSVIGKKFKEGDVGAIGLSWNDAYKKPRGLTEASHTLNWIIKDGKVNFMDGQVGIDGDRLSNFMSSFMDSGKEASVARFANVSEGLSMAADTLSRFAN